MKKPLRILLIRHGESEGNVDPKAYLEKGDQNVALTTRGEEQALAMGTFLGRYLFLGRNLEDSYTTDWPLFYVSGYKRPQQTLGFALQSMGYGTEYAPFEDDPLIYTDPRLAEHFFGAMNFLEEAELPEQERQFADFLLKASKAVFEKDSIVAKTPNGESYLDKLVHVKGFIDGSLRRDIEDGHHDIVIVAHGRIVTAFLAAWFHVPLDQIKAKIKNPNNCDVIEISGEPNNWKATKIYDGPSGEVTDQPLLTDITPISESVLGIAKP